VTEGRRQIHESEVRQRTIFGRRKGKALRPGRQDLVDRVLPDLRLSLDALPRVIDPNTLFDRPAGADTRWPVREIWLEIGFGHGEHLAYQLETHPDIAIIGAEYYLNGVARLLAHLWDRTDDRSSSAWPVRILQDDARLLLSRLAPATIGRAFILHPDPWPKQRHHKRRVVSTPTLDALAACMEDGAELRMASDDPGYVSWMLDHALRHPDFEWLAEGPGDWRHDGAGRPGDWPQTKYEHKALAQGRRCTLLRFRRRHRGCS